MPGWGNAQVTRRGYRKPHRTPLAARKGSGSRTIVNMLLHEALRREAGDR